MTHDDPVIGTGEEFPAVPKPGKNSVLQVVFIDISEKVAVGNRMYLHRMDGGTGHARGNAEIPDPGEHIGYPFTRAYQPHHPLLLRPVPR